MKPIARLPNALAPQGVRVIMDLAWQIPDAIHLEVGEPNFTTPHHIVEATVTAARGGFHKYTPNAGIEELRVAIANKMAWYNKMKVQTNQVCVHPGAVEGLFSVMMALLEPGDEVLVPGLSWPNGEMSIRLLHGVPVHYSLSADRGFLPNLTELECLVSERTKAMLINSPGNPTGTIFDETVMQGLVAFCARHDLWLISDEIYEHIVFDKPHVSPGRFAPERTITLSGFSKAYAMTGWRLGYTVSPPEVASVITKIQEPLISSTNSLVQKAGLAALNGPQDVVEEMRQAYHRRRDVVVEILKQYGLFRYAPQGAFYLMIDVSQVNTDSFAIAKQILRETKVAVAPGEAFGRDGTGLVRVSLANSEENLQLGVERICRYVRDHGRNRQ